MTESKVSVAERQKLEAEAAIYWTQVGKGIIDVAVEEGLWLALMIDMAAITGKIYHYTYDEKGNKHGNFLWSQRYHMVETVRWFTNKQIDVAGVLNVPNPLGHIFRFMEPLVDVLDEKVEEVVEMGEVTVEHPIPGFMGKGRPPVTIPTRAVQREYYVPLEPIPRMMCIFMLPGILRVIVRKIEGMSVI